MIISEQNHMLCSLSACKKKLYFMQWILEKVKKGGNQFHLQKVFKYDFKIHTEKYFLNEQCATITISGFIECNNFLLLLNVWLWH